LAVLQVNDFFYVGSEFRRDGIGDEFRISSSSVVDYQSFHRPSSTCWFLAVSDKRLLVFLPFGHGSVRCLLVVCIQSCQIFSAPLTELILFKIRVREAIGEEHHTSLLSTMFQMENVSKLVNSFLSHPLQKKLMIILQTVIGWSQPCDGYYGDPISWVRLSEYKIE